MAKARNKTLPTDSPVEGYLAAIADDARRADCRTVADLMKRVTGFEPEMWGPGIVGFGRYTCRYESGRQSECPVVGFASRKAAITLYLGTTLDAVAALLPRLGPHTTGKGCLYLKKLDDVDLGVLRRVIETAAATPPVA